MRRPSRGATHAAALSLAAACALLASEPGTAAPPKPMVLAAYTDTAPPNAAAGAPGCRIRITSLTDTRADPAVIGVYLQRGVMAPADRQAWLTGIVSALSARGVTPVFDDGGSADIPKAGLVLEKAWVTNVASDIAASVVFRVDDAGADGTVTLERFRGTQQKMTYFSGGEEKIQHGVDSAIAQALDTMAAHFLTRCAARVANASAPPG